MKDGKVTGKAGPTAAEELALLIERKRQENRALLKMVSLLKEKEMPGKALEGNVDDEGMEEKDPLLNPTS